MPDFPNWFAGTVTLAALVGLGVFVYPWLLGRPGGAVVVGAVTVILGFIFFGFDRGKDVAAATSAALALLWALAPVAAGVLVYRLQRKPTD
jgi:multisubunit Na+/H+ antiporter MnhG subunit